MTPKETPVKEVVVTPPDKTILPSKVYLVLSTGRGWPKDDMPMEQVWFYTNLDKAKNAMAVGCVMYEVRPVTRYVCKKAITQD